MRRAAGRRRDHARPLPSPEHAHSVPTATDTFTHLATLAAEPPSPEGRLGTLTFLYTCPIRPSSSALRSTTLAESPDPPGGRATDAPSPVTAARRLEPSDRSGGPTRPSEDLRWARGEANHRWPGQPFGPNPSADLVGAPEGNSYAVTPRRTGPGLALPRAPPRPQRAQPICRSLNGRCDSYRAAHRRHHRADHGYGRGRHRVAVGQRRAVRVRR